MALMSYSDLRRRLRTVHRISSLRRMPKRITANHATESLQSTMRSDYAAFILQDKPGRFSGGISYKIRNGQDVRLLIKKLAESVKDELSATKLAGLVTATGCKTNADSVLGYLRNIQDAYLCFPIANHYAAFAEREGIQKRYFSDNGLLSLFLIDKNPLLLGNLVAIMLVNRYGLDNVHYIKSSRTGLDLDFFIPSTGAIYQVTWTLDISSRSREIAGLVKAHRLISVASRFVILSYEEENCIQADGFEIEVIPV